MENKVIFESINSALNTPIPIDRQKYIIYLYLRLDGKKDRSLPKVDDIIRKNSPHSKGNLQSKTTQYE